MAWTKTGKISHGMMEFMQYEEIRQWCDEYVGENDWGYINNQETIQYMFREAKYATLFIMAFPTLWQTTDDSSLS